MMSDLVNSIEDLKSKESEVIKIKEVAKGAREPKKSVEEKNLFRGDRLYIWS